VPSVTVSPSWGIVMFTGTSVGRAIIRGMVDR